MKLKGDLILINQISRTNSKKTSSSSKKSRTNESNGSKFESLFIKSNLENMVQDIITIGQRLRRNPTIERLKDYKDKIKNFMEKVIDSVDDMKDFTGNNSKNGKEKVYKLMGKVDEEMEELTQIILSGQRDSIKILSKIDAIRGMLVDVYQ